MKEKITHRVSPQAKEHLKLKAIEKKIKQSQLLEIAIFNIK
jgi:hypothetical protein